MNRFKSNTLRTYSVPTDPDNDGTFNPLDIISGIETIDYASLEQQILSKYLPLSGGTVSSLAVDSGFYIPNQQQQIFGSSQLALLNNVDTKTSRIVFNGALLSSNCQPTLCDALPVLMRKLATNFVKLFTRFANTTPCIIHLHATRTSGHADDTRAIRYATAPPGLGVVSTATATAPNPRAHVHVYAYTR
jgi:hypothetical protein